MKGHKHLKAVYGSKIKKTHIYYFCLENSAGLVRKLGTHRGGCCGALREELTVFFVLLGRSSLPTSPSWTIYKSVSHSFLHRILDFCCCFCFFPMAVNLGERDHTQLGGHFCWFCTQEALLVVLIGPYGMLRIPRLPYTR